MGGVQSSQKKHTFISELSRENSPEHQAHRSDFNHFYALFIALTRPLINRSVVNWNKRGRYLTKCLLGEIKTF